MTALLTLTGLTILLGTIVVLNMRWNGNDRTQNNLERGTNMTNKEFYDDKLLAITLTCVCRKLYKTVYGENCAMSKKCEDCEFCTVESVESWLNAEHVEPEPPLLENGDGLNPGDWIMVRYYTADKWHKRQFMCFYNGVFYTAEGPFNSVGHHTFSRWNDARLLKDGE